MFNNVSDTWTEIILLTVRVETIVDKSDFILGIIILGINFRLHFANLTSISSFLCSDCVSERQILRGFDP